MADMLDESTDTTKTKTNDASPEQQQQSQRPQHQQHQYFHHNKRTSSSSSLYHSNNNNSSNNNRRQHTNFHRIQTEHSNLNQYRPSAPFQPASYHHNTNQIIDKYNRKYNLISFILLRKFDNYMTEEKAYLNDQLLYNQIQEYIQNSDIDSVFKFFKENKDISSYKNSYNSSFFVYTVREALESAQKQQQETNEFVDKLFNHLFEAEQLPADLSSLNDGDYPMRNIMHYSATHNSTMLLQLIYKKLQSDDIEKLCMLTDYNGNTPLHLAVQTDSLQFIQHLFENSKEIFKQINFDYAYNYDGYNLLLLACRCSSLELIKYLHETVGLSVNLKELNQNSLKTSLHLAVLRTADKDKSCFMNAFMIIKYLYEKNNYLAYELSPLVGSVYHLAATNLTRLHVLWYFLCEYNEKMDKSNALDTNLSVNSVDFRQYSCIDCFIDTLINIRSIIPSGETVFSFYKKYFYNDHFESELCFDLLIRKCLFKLICKCKAKITKLPQIKSQLELLEFIRLLTFMSKFHFKLQTKFDSMYYTKFEAFCLKFLNTFIFTGDLLSVLVAPTNETDVNNNQTVTTALNDTLLAIFTELIELTRIIVNSGFFTSKFQHKIYSFMCDYFTNLSLQCDKHSTVRFCAFLHDLQRMNKKAVLMSLRELCRYKVNHCLFKSKSSANSTRDEIYFSLPTKSLPVVNFLSFNLIQDLFGHDLSSVNPESDEIFKYI